MGEGLKIERHPLIKRHFNEFFSFGNYGTIFRRWEVPFNAHAFSFRASIKFTLSSQNSDQLVEK